LLQNGIDLAAYFVLGCASKYFLFAAVNDFQLHFRKTRADWMETTILPGMVARDSYHLCTSISFELVARAFFQIFLSKLIHSANNTNSFLHRTATTRSSTTN
jgi:hypothetical protein